MKKEELSDGWEIISIGNLIEENISGFSCAISKLVEKDGYVHLRPFNLAVDGELDLNTLYQVPTDIVDQERYNLKIGDILYNNTNSTELVGKSVYIKEEYPYAFSNHISRIRVNKEKIHPRYLHYHLQNMFFKGHFALNCKKWIGQSGYSVKKLMKQEIIIPSSLKEQKKIISIIETATVEYIIIREAIERQNQAARQLYSSILEKVMRGPKYDEE